MLVGSIGLGAIGAPMAAHLAQRWPLTVWNRTQLGESADYLEATKLIEQAAGVEIRE